jgi:hypothetical protein
MANVKPQVPSMGLGNQNGNVLNDPEIGGAMKGVLEEAGNVMKAKATAEVLKGITGGGQTGGSGITEGIGNLLTGVAEAFGKNSEISTMMIDRMMKGQSNGNGGSGDSMMMMMLLIQMMNQSQATIMTMMKQGSEESKAWMMHLMETIKESKDQRIAELEARSGASPLDQQVHGQLVPMIIAKALETANRDPLEHLVEIADKSDKLKSVFKGLYGNNGDGAYSEGALRMMALENERLDIVKKHETAMEKFKHDSSKLKDISGIAANIGQSLLGALGGMGFVPMANISQADEAAAMAAMNQGV